MTVTILLPLLVCIAGMLMYALASNANAREIAKAMLWTGMLVTLLEVSTKTLKF
jgi:hypothetical protein